DNNGIWFTQFNGHSWSLIDNVKRHRPELGIAKGTSPCPVSFGQKLYLFFNGAGMDGIFCVTKYNGTHWDQFFEVAQAIGATTSINFLPSTSPSATTFQNSIHLFWNGVDDTGIFSTTFDGNKWSPPINVAEKAPGLVIAQGTSPAAIAYKGHLYLFYNGAEDGGTGFTRLSVQGNWERAQSVKALIGFMGYLEKTSPSAFLINGGETLCLSWTGCGRNGTWYVTRAGDKWLGEQKSLSREVGEQKIESGSACGVEFLGTLYIFWKHETHGLYMTTGLPPSAKNVDWPQLLTNIQNGRMFLLVVEDTQAISALEAIANKTAEGNLSQKIFNDDSWTASTQFNTVLRGIRMLTDFAIIAGGAWHLLRNHLNGGQRLVVLTYIPPAMSELQQQFEMAVV
ncbi:hypothetical protein M408DRAFT_329733, partial [Serendipita vermifera MAFF 305830]